MAVFEKVTTMFGIKKNKKKQKDNDSQHIVIEVPQELEDLASQIDKKMCFKPGRTKRVADISLEMLRRMHKDADTCERVVKLAYAFDAGFLLVPDEILSKPDKLTEEELKTLKEKVISYEDADVYKDVSNVLKDIPNANQIIRAHFERYDGKGYPDGLEEKEIPFETRVLQIATAYVSMTSKRPYHDVFTKGMARGEIIANKVSQFDPVAADALIDMIDEDIDYKLREL
ncbi:MAG: hypothetical protein K6F37_03485 [Lachnospiraceae bacterium]|nr:hypothetical protein [Lachnospiraceae bacterium]